MSREPKKLLTGFVEPFRSGHGYHLGLIVAFLVINGLVAANAVLHDPTVGYDAEHHLAYIESLSHLRLVTPDVSLEYFSPPLPYAVPALVQAATGIGTFWAAKLAQALNAGLSLVLTFTLLKAVQVISPRPSLRFGTLLFLGLLPVYTKTFAFVRPEPYLACFAVVMLYYALQMLIRRRFSTANAARLGLAMGLCALSRQWGLLLFPAVFLALAVQWVRMPRWRGAIARALSICLALVAVTGGWFYLSLQLRYGSTTAFNRQPAERFALSNQPREFYVGLGLPDLFSQPIRPSFPNQLVPLFYSELWGDYWCDFTVYGRDTRTSTFASGYELSQIITESHGRTPDWLVTNYQAASAYLGRVNLVSLFPSGVALVALAAAAVEVLRRPYRDQLRARPRTLYAFLLLATGATVAGYLWFLIMYPDLGKGDTIKATYVLQVFPFVAILVGILLERVKARSQWLYWLLLAGLCLSFAHNLPGMVTNYWW